MAWQDWFTTSRKISGPELLEYLYTLLSLRSNLVISMEGQSWTCTMLSVSPDTLIVTNPFPYMSSVLHLKDKNLDISIASANQVLRGQTKISAMITYKAEPALQLSIPKEMEDENERKDLRLPPVQPLFAIASIGDRFNGEVRIHDISSHGAALMVLDTRYHFSAVKNGEKVIVSIKLPEKTIDIQGEICYSTGTKCGIIFKDANPKDIAIYMAYYRELTSRFEAFKLETDLNNPIEMPSIPQAEITDSVFIYTEISTSLNFWMNCLKRKYHIYPVELTTNYIQSKIIDFGTPVAILIELPKGVDTITHVKRFIRSYKLTIPIIPFNENQYIPDVFSGEPYMGNYINIEEHRILKTFKTFERSIL